jgi:hypothetical protein
MLEYGTATLEIKAQNVYTVEATTYQMLLLCALDGCRLSMSQLEERTGLHETDFESDLRLLVGLGLVLGRDLPGRAHFRLNLKYEAPPGSRHVVLPRLWSPAPLTRQQFATLKSHTEHGIIRHLCSYRQMKRWHLKAEIYQAVPQPGSRSLPFIFARVFDEELTSLVARDYVRVEMDEHGEEWCHRVF